MLVQVLLEQVPVLLLELLNQVPVFLLECRPDLGAVEAAEQAIFPERSV